MQIKHRYNVYSRMDGKDTLIGTSCAVSQAQAVNNVQYRRRCYGLEYGKCYAILANRDEREESYGN